MKKTVIFSLVVLLAPLIATYFYFSGREYVLTISEDELQQRFADKIPISQSYLALLHVSFDNLRVKLIDNSERVNAGLDVLLNLKLTDMDKPFGGSFDISGGITYVATEGGFYLTDPQVDNMTMHGLPDKYLTQVTQVIEALFASYYDRYPIYTLKSSHLKHKFVQAVLKKVIIRDKKLFITLGFKK